MPERRWKLEATSDPPYLMWPCMHPDGEILIENTHGRILDDWETPPDVLLLLAGLEKSWSGTIVELWEAAWMLADV